MYFEIYDNASVRIFAEAAAGSVWRKSWNDAQKLGPNERQTQHMASGLCVKLILGCCSKTECEMVV